MEGRELSKIEIVFDGVALAKEKEKQIGKLAYEIRGPCYTFYCSETSDLPNLCHCCYGSKSISI